MISRLDIFYDNFCPNCTRFIKFIEKFDWFNLIVIYQLRNIAHIKSAKGINQNLAEKQMASFTNKWSYGYETLFKIFVRVPLFWTVLPLLYVLKISNLGQYLYLQLAINRKIIPLHCSENSCELK